ncbi:MAG: butyrate kinase [Clostridiales bacterium]|mgnify:CR=1 FL=1|nr:butyrate kinase [Clostridiales bacterium]
MPVYGILAINPGSTSTKVAYFRDVQCLSSITLHHKADQFKGINSVMGQYSIRKAAILEYIEQAGIKTSRIDAVVGRGGLLKPLKGGTYTVGIPMLEDLKSQKYGEHASNLGAVIAYEIAKGLDKPSYIVNPVVVDELEPLARYSGLSLIDRKSIFHALNHKAVAVRAAAELGKRYEELNLLVAHLGGGISVAAHKKGRVIDANNGLEEGAFSPERTGHLPVLQLMDLCLSGKYPKEEIKKKLVGQGGMADYLGTSDCRVVEERIRKGDNKAREVLEAMAYQIAKEIGALSTVLEGRVDTIIITGGLARSPMLVDWIIRRVQFIATVRVFPGEDEMLAMAEGVYRVLTGEEEAYSYT